jgi:methylthioribulose-1-phosphate dehydratase
MITIGKNFYDKGWLSATSGNLSARYGDNILITGSGKHKGFLSEKDFLLLNLDGEIIEGSGKPSGETQYHLQLYKKFEKVNAVIHTHSVYSSLVSLVAGKSLKLKGNELIKAFEGINLSDCVTVPVFPNIQDKEEMITYIEKYLQNNSQLLVGYILKEHGLFACASSIDAAQIYTEALEFFFKYEYLKKTS